MAKATLVTTDSAWASVPSGIGIDNARNTSQALCDFPLTDIGNSERFATRFGADLHYSATETAWHSWLGTHWGRDQSGRVMQAAKTVIRELYAEASQIEDDRSREALVTWARKCESLDRLRAMITLATSEEPIPITTESWNVDPWLLNCANGTIDLRSGALLPHRREDLITRFAPVEYVPGATHDLWTRFLKDVTGGDEEFEEFLQRAVGYSATGDTREEKLFMVLGPGGSGKSTFLEAVRATLGDYTRVTDFETFVQKRDPGVRNDIAALAGRRFVVSVEVEEGKKLAEGLVKSLTGRDTIAARFLHQEYFEFRPQFKLWLAANDPPRVRHHDSAIWRRILRVPFDAAIPASRRDPTLKDKLCQLPECRTAILAWLVEGCVKWLERGLQEPKRVQTATTKYREDQNPLREFVEENCSLTPGAVTSFKTLRQAYETWAREAGVGVDLTVNRFADALKALGCQAEKRREGRCWRGIALVEVDDVAA